MKQLYFRVTTIDWPHGLARCDALAVDVDQNLSKVLARYNSALYFPTLAAAQASADDINAQYKKEGRLYE